MRDFLLHAFNRIEHLCVCGAAAFVAFSSSHIIEAAINGGLAIVIVGVLILEFWKGSVS